LPLVEAAAVKLRKVGHTGTLLIVATVCLLSGIELHAGLLSDSLTFLSDGVVEARSPSCELFGFDRTRAISCETAEAIAEAALAFGQEDDITVLTLAFTGAEVAEA
jgi:hypothetical protein